MRKRLQLECGISLIIAAMVLSLPQFAAAGGVLVAPLTPEDFAPSSSTNPVAVTSPVLKEGWRYFPEDFENAFIVHRDGIQKMVVAVGLKNNTMPTAWIFPIPAPADQITALPAPVIRFAGLDLARYWDTEFLQDTARPILLHSQIYPAIYELFWRWIREPIDSIDNVPPAGWEGIYDVYYPSIAPSVEEQGITPHIFSANAVKALYAYLREHHIPVQDGALSSLDPYLQKGFSFAVAILPPRTPATQTRFFSDDSDYAKAMFLSFPSEHIFFPLRATSVYDTKKVSIDVRIAGFARPLGQGISEYKYYSKASWDVRKWRAPTDDFERVRNYTAISIYGKPAKMLTKDLIAVGGAPLPIYFIEAVILHKYPFVIGLFVLISMLAAILAGVIVFGNLRKRVGLFALIGLSNFATIIGVIMTTMFLGTKDEIPAAQPLLAKLRKSGYIRMRRIALVLAAIFLVIWFLLSVSSSLSPLWLEDIRLHIALSTYSFLFWEAWNYLLPSIILATFLGTFVALAWAWWLGHRNRELVRKLKKLGYSVVSFHPKDRRKFFFVVLFSIFFTILASRVIDFLHYLNY